MLCARGHLVEPVPEAKVAREQLQAFNTMGVRNAYCTLLLDL